MGDMEKKLNIVVVIEETSYYHPELLQNFLKKYGAEVSGVVRVTEVKYSFSKWCRPHLLNFKMSEVFNLIKRETGFLLTNFLPFLQSKAYSLKPIIKKFNKDFIDVSMNINEKSTLDWIRTKKPDLIMNYSATIFKKEILNIPKYGCLNRHSSLLPTYQGLFPVFHCVRLKEKYIGASIHFMTEKIDQGEIIAQFKYELPRNKSVDEIYEENFKYCLELSIDAVEKIRKGDWTAIKSDLKGSYFSLPSKDELKEFYRVGGRFL